VLLLCLALQARDCWCFYWSLTLTLIKTIWCNLHVTHSFFPVGIRNCEWLHTSSFSFSFSFAFQRVVCFADMTSTSANTYEIRSTSQQATTSLSKEVISDDMETEVCTLQSLSFREYLCFYRNISLLLRKNLEPEQRQLPALQSVLLSRSKSWTRGAKFWIYI